MQALRTSWLPTGDITTSPWARGQLSIPDPDPAICVDRRGMQTRRGKVLNVLPEDSDPSRSEDQGSRVPAFLTKT